MEIRSHIFDKFLRLARKIWRQNPIKTRANMSEYRRSREFFGCSVLVVSSVWRQLEVDFRVTDDYELVHLLWSHIFMKVYPKQQVRCILVTIRNIVWRMIEDVSDLEADVVSVFSVFNFVFIDVIFPVLLKNCL